MSVRNQEYYNQNSVIPYPLWDTVSLTSDAGERLPSNIICDLKLRFPRTLGRYVYLAACTVTPNIVTVVFYSSASASVASVPAPIAAVSIAQPVTPYKTYAIEPLADGVGGWIVFGTGVEETYSGRFSSPSQSLVLARAALSYVPIGVQSLGEYGNSQALTGLVSLLGGTDIEIVKDCRYISAAAPTADCENNMTQAVIVRLADTSGQASTRNVLDVYKGSCNVRPESGNCGDPAPIEFIGPVGPDCCGQITLELGGCAKVTKVQHENIYDVSTSLVDTRAVNDAVIDCSVGLGTLCGDRQANLPDESGRLPNEPSTSCSVMYITLPPKTGGTGGGGVGEGTTLPSSDTKPSYWTPTPTCVLAEYDPLNVLTADGSISGYSHVDTLGLWMGTGTTPEPAYVTNGTCARTYATGGAGSETCLCRKATATFAIQKNYAYANVTRRFGIIFGYNQSSSPHEFYAAEVLTNGDGLSYLLIRYFENWIQASAVTQAVSLPWLVATDTAGTLSVSITDPQSDGALVSAQFTKGANTATTAAVRRFPKANGRWGVMMSFTSLTVTAFDIITV